MSTMNSVYVVLCFAVWAYPQEIVFKLCCKQHEIFDVSSNSCVVGTNDLVLPVLEDQGQVNSTIVTYETCESNKFLVALEPDEDYKMLPKKNNKIPYFAPRDIQYGCFAFTGDEWYVAQCKRKINVQFCCQKGHMLDVATDSCRPVNGHEIRVNVLVHGIHKYDPIEFGYTEEFFNVTVAKTPCGEKDLHHIVETYSHPKTFLIDYHSEHLLLPAEHDASLKAWKEDEYCVSTNNEDKTIVRLCYSDPCKDRVCIKKCCEQPLVFSSEQLRCVVSDKVESATWPIRAEDGTPVEERVHEVYSQLPICSNYEIPGNFVHRNSNDHTFWILPNGMIFDQIDEDRSFSTNKYCIDTTVGNGTQEIFAMYCMPWGDSIDPYEIATDEEYLYFGLMTFSCFFLLLLIIVHLLLPDLRNLHGISIMCQAACLIVSFMGIGLIKIKLGPKDEHSCIVFGFIVHFCLIASFSWLSTMAVDFFWMFSGIVSLHGHLKSNDNKKLVLYNIFAWGLPLTLTSSAAAETQIRQSLFKNACWFHEEDIWYFVHGPIAALLILNVFFFTFTAFRLYAASRVTSTLTPGDRKRARQRMMAIVKLFILMGLNWFTELILVATRKKSEVVHITFDVINMLIPFLIFVLVVLTRRVLDLFGLTYFAIGDFLRKYGWEPKTRSCHGSRKSRRATVSRRAQESRSSRNRKASSTSEEGRRFNDSLLDRTVVTDTGI